MYFYIRYAKLVTPCIQNDIMGRSIRRYTEKLVVSSDFWGLSASETCTYLFSKFSNFKIWLSYLSLILNFDFVYDKIRSNGIITVTFEFYVEIGP